MHPALYFAFVILPHQNSNGLSMLQEKCFRPTAKTRYRVPLLVQTGSFTGPIEQSSGVPPILQLQCHRYLVFSYTGCPSPMSFNLVTRTQNNRFDWEQQAGGDIDVNLRQSSNANSFRLVGKKSWRIRPTKQNTMQHICIAPRLLPFACPSQDSNLKLRFFHGCFPEISIH